MLLPQCPTQAKEHVLGKTGCLEPGNVPRGSRRGSRSAMQPVTRLMPNELELDIDVYGCVDPLRRLETLAREMRQPAWLSQPAEEREAKETEFVSLQEGLPPSVMWLLRSRLSVAQKLLAPVRRSKCTACYMSVPRGDQGTILTGRTPVVCQHCGVLLYLDEAERAATIPLKPR